MAKAPKGSGTVDSPVIIKKYANRRLYNTDTSAYITLDNLAEMTRAGREFKVVDAKTEEDITHKILTQIIMDEESRGQTMLPSGFFAAVDLALRQLNAIDGVRLSRSFDEFVSAQS